MRTIAIVNQKGGCGKTTTAVNLAGCLAAAGRRVLLVDTDPQAHATLALGCDPDLVEENLFDVLAEEHAVGGLEHTIVSAGDGLDLVPSGIALSALEQKLAAEAAHERTERLTRALAALPRAYDLVVIDCPPQVGLLTFNALRASREVIVPLETSFLAIHGAEKLLETLGLLAERVAHEVGVRVLPTMYDGRTRSARQTLAEIREQWKALCFQTVIRANVTLREAARRGIPIVRFAPGSSGAADYTALAREVAEARPRAEATREEVETAFGDVLPAAPEPQPAPASLGAAPVRGGAIDPPWRDG